MRIAKATLEIEGRGQSVTRSDSKSVSKSHFLTSSLWRHIRDSDNFIMTSYQPCLDVSVNLNVFHGWGFNSENLSFATI